MNLRLQDRGPLSGEPPGETAQQIALRDWSDSPVGPSGAWPQAFRTALDLALHARQPAFVAWGPELSFFYNDALAPIVGPAHPLAIGRPFREVWPDIWPMCRPMAEATMAGEALYISDQPIQLRPGEPTRWFTYSWTPLRDETDTVRGFYGMAIETTDKMLGSDRQRAKAEAALRKSEARYRTLHESLRDAFVECSLDGRFVAFNDHYCAMLGYTPEELRNLTYLDLTPERWREPEAAIVRDQITARGYSDLYEKEYQRKDGTVVPVEIRTMLSRDAEGNPESMWAIVRDISERKAREQQVQFLLREVNHRSKNLLTLVQAVARQTASVSREDFLNRFNDRLQSLAANQDLLVKSEWNGVDLEELVRSQLAHFGDLVDRRIVVSGGPVVVSAAASQTLAMAIHELATNASKYGALSNDSGKVTIGWQSGPDDRFAFWWLEEGGPSVEPPLRKGFGTMVIMGATQAGLGAEIAAEYGSSGFCWRMTCSLSRVAEASVYPEQRRSAF